MRSFIVQAALALALLGATLTTVVVFTHRPLIRLGTGLPPATHEVASRTEYQVPMRDGVHLSTAVTLPEGEGPWPVVLIRNPYDLLDAFSLVCEQFASIGYACVHQDVRGRMGSEGEWSPLVNERQDGLDTFEWLREQPFQNGRWALWGMSYLAGVQWAVADALPDEVKTMVSMVFGVDTPSVMYEGGLFRPDMFSAWAALMPDASLALHNGSAYAQLIRHRPALEADVAVLGKELPWYREWLQASRADHPLWTQSEFVHFFDTPTRVRVPVMMLGAFYDPFFDAQRRDFERLATRSKSKFLVGPWNHTQQDASDLERPHDIGFFGQAALVEDWLHHHLKGTPLHQSVGQVEVYDMGVGGWRRQPDFPMEGDEKLSLYLEGSGCPGRLSPKAPPADAIGRYAYDPEDPTPSIGGAAALAFAIHTFPAVEPGARRQPPPCARPDLLSFVSDPLEAPLTVSGAVRAELKVASSAPDTAFGFELMVRPPDDPAWYHVREAYSALSARPGEAAFTRGSTTTVALKAWPIEWTIPAGGQLRVDVRSASFPLYAAHPNRSGPWAAMEGSDVAEQTVFGGSSVTLPLRVTDEPVRSAAALSRVPPRHGL